MRTLLLCLVLIPAATTVATAKEIRVHPKGVGVNGHGATTVFLTFGPFDGYQPAEAVWCGALVPATPDVGLRCDPGTVFGSLPARFDLSRLTGDLGFTDIMSIPPSVVRRAYQDAQRGQEPRFFYVRRFVSTTGGPDQYIDVTCRLTSGGARTPFALTGVKVAFDTGDPVMFIKPGDPAPQLEAEILYNGTGRLKGRWEVVLPGEELPAPRDLLTEATLPAEERGSQRRYTPVAQFNVFLPPTGRHVLPGPDAARLPVRLEGMYLVLLRIEASDDKEGDSDLAAVGAGSGTVHSGGVAGFPLPVLRYFVGSGKAASSPSNLSLLLPADGARLTADQAVTFTWTESENGRVFRLEVETERGDPVLAAVIPAGLGVYRAPSWLKDRSRGGALRWRVVALDTNGRPAGETQWRSLHLLPGQ